MSKINEHLDAVGPGWTAILKRLHADVQALAPDYQVMQIKEKFGALRIYLTYPHEPDVAVQDLVHAAEIESETTCEQCGQPGTLVGKYWLQTLCEEHRLAAEKAKAERWR